MELLNAFVVGYPNEIGQAYDIHSPRKPETERLWACCEGDTGRHAVGEPRLRAEDPRLAESTSLRNMVEAAKSLRRTMAKGL